MKSIFCILLITVSMVVYVHCIEQSEIQSNIETDSFDSGYQITPEEDIPPGRVKRQFYGGYGGGRRFGGYGGFRGGYGGFRGGYGGYGGGRRYGGYGGYGGYGK